LRRTSEESLRFIPAAEPGRRVLIAASGTVKMQAETDVRS